jgi:hypothetical protein
MSDVLSTPLAAKNGWHTGRLLLGPSLRKLDRKKFQGLFVHVMGVVVVIMGVVVNSSPARPLGILHMYVL